MSEKPEQSLERKFQMARPRRAEVKRVPLTDKEKEFLGKIMTKAVAAEKAGELAEALGYYTDYRNELSEIKESLAEKELEYTVDLEEYDGVSVPQDIRGKIVFASLKNGKWFIVNEQGEKVGEEYDRVGDPQDIGGKIAFVAQKDEKWFIVNEEGEKFGEEYDYVCDPQDIGGKITFAAEKDGKSFIVNEKGEKIGQGYDDVHNPLNIGGKIVFVAKKMVNFS